MLDQHPPLVRLPVPVTAGRALVLASVFVCAACGLVYELELVALASYLVGDSVTQASVVLSVMVFAMGVGSLLAKRLRCRAAVGFALIEAFLALIGGLSAMALYAGFAWFGWSNGVMTAFAFAIGVLIGAEIPLLMTLIMRIRREDAGGAVADLFAADYVGALVGGLAFPFVLLPFFGQLTGALLTGAVNVAAGGSMVLGLFRRDLSARARGRLLVAYAAALGVLAAAYVCAGPFENAARQALYGAHVRLAEQTGDEEVVLTDRPVQLFLDGRLWLRGPDGYRYVEALVDPAMAGRHRRVLLLGGGDGLALHEILRYRDVRAVTVVGSDPGLLHIAATDPALTALNGRAFDDPRADAVTADAFGWLRAHRARGGAPYDVIIADLPDPGISRSAKLYSQEFYGLAAAALAPDGRLAVHAGSPGVRPAQFWTVDASVRAAGLRTLPYWMPGGSGPEWGLLLAAARPPALRLTPQAPALRFVTPKVLAAAARTAEAGRIAGAPPSTVMRPRYGVARRAPWGPARGGRWVGSPVWSMRRSFRIRWRPCGGRSGNPTGSRGVSPASSGTSIRPPRRPAHWWDGCACGSAARPSPTAAASGSPPATGASRSRARAPSPGASGRSRSPW
jgi:spermidine synthase